MKSNLLLITFFFAFISVSAQIQTGLVREQNSGKKPIVSAQIIFTDATPASSDQSGNFRLAFSGKKTGDLIFLKEIAKKGYEIVNERELQVLKIGNDNKLGKDIILAKAGVLDAAKKEYYDISDKALWASFNKAKNTLQQQLKNAQITQEAYLVKFDTLSHQFEQQQKSLDALADVFARVNFDDVSEDYKKAFAFFEIGKIDDALVLLEKANLLNRTKNRIQERKRVEKAADALAQQKSENEKGIKEDLQGMQLQAQLYVLTFQIEKAEKLYDQMVRLDSTDLEILMDAADFYQDNHRYYKGVWVNTLASKNPRAEAWQTANANSHLGELYILTGDLPNALDALNKCYESYKLLAQHAPTSIFYKINLAISHEILGSSHIALGNLPKALAFFEDDAELFKELYTDYPQNLEFKYGLAISYSKLGSTYSSLGNLGKALTFFEQYNSLIKELGMSYPQNVKLKSNLGISYSKLGSTQSMLGNLPKALTFFQLDNELFKELYAAYPQNVDFKSDLAISYSKLGETHSMLGNLPKALIFFEDELKLFQELFTAYPQNLSFKNGLAISYEKLGVTHNAMGNLDKALTFFEDETELFKELYTTSPQNVSFKNGLAISYEKLGLIYSTLGNLDKALTFFKDETELLKELYAAYPQNVQFKNGLAISYLKLGETHSTFGNLLETLTFFEQFNLLAKELYAVDSQNVSFKSSLAISYGKLGSAHSILGNLQVALAFFEKEIKVFKELCSVYPQNVSFKNDLALSYGKLGETHSTLGNLPKALTFFEQSNLLYKELYAAFPQKVSFKNGLAISYLNEASIYLQTKEGLKAKKHLQEAKKYFTELHQISPQNSLFKQYLDLINDVLAELEPSDIISQLQNRIQNETDTLKIFSLYSELCDTLRHRIAFDLPNKAALAGALNSLAWYGFFLKKFEDVENAILEGLSLKTDNKFLPSNLAPVLLFQGKRNLAFKEYRKWKDHPFGEQNLPTYREAFLEDLKAFEKAGIIPPERKADVAAVRKLLNEPKKK